MSTSKTASPPPFATSPRNSAIEHSDNLLRTIADDDQSSDGNISSYGSSRPSSPASENSDHAIVHSTHKTDNIFKNAAAADLKGNDEIAKDKEVAKKDKKKKKKDKNDNEKKADGEEKNRRAPSKSAIEHLPKPSKRKNESIAEGPAAKKNKPSSSTASSRTLRAILDHTPIFPEVNFTLTLQEMKKIRFRGHIVRDVEESKVNLLDNRYTTRQLFTVPRQLIPRASKRKLIVFIPEPRDNRMILIKGNHRFVVLSKRGFDEDEEDIQFTFIAYKVSKSVFDDCWSAAGTLKYDRLKEWSFKSNVDRKNIPSDMYQFALVTAIKHEFATKVKYTKNDQLCYCFKVFKATLSREEIEQYRLKPELLEDAIAAYEKEDVMFKFDKHNGISPLKLFIASEELTEALLRGWNKGKEFPSESNFFGMCYRAVGHGRSKKLVKEIKKYDYYASQPVRDGKKKTLTDKVKKLSKKPPRRSSVRAAKEHVKRGVNIIDIMKIKSLDKIDDLNQTNTVVFDKSIPEDLLEELAKKKCNVVVCNCDMVAKTRLNVLKLEQLQSGNEECLNSGGGVHKDYTYVVAGPQVIPPRDSGKYISQTIPAIVNRWMNTEGKKLTTTCRSILYYFVQATDDEKTFA